MLFVVVVVVTVVVVVIRLNVALVMIPCIWNTPLVVVVDVSSLVIGIIAVVVGSSGESTAGAGGPIAIVDVGAKAGCLSRLCLGCRVCCRCCCRCDVDDDGSLPNTFDLALSRSPQISTSC